MDSRDIVVLGLLGVGGYLAWRWWTNRPIADAADTAPATVAGAAASSMTASAARTTVFGGGTLVKRLLGTPVPIMPSSPRLSPTAPAAVLAGKMNANYAPVQREVGAAVLAPLPVAPSPNNLRWSATGLLAPVGTMPRGDQPQPGDPSPATILQTRSVS